MDFEQARQRTGEKLSGKIDALRDGREPAALEPFAKAYLGMFLAIDDSVEPPARVNLLADEPLAQSIREGFVAVLQRTDLPTPEEIGARFAQGRRLALGYVVLAGVDSAVQADAQALYDLPDRTLASALCFYHINTPSHRMDWGARLLAERPEVAGPALRAVWHELIPTVSDHLPGLRQVLRHQGAETLRRELLLPLIAQWQHCKQTVLRELLLAALRSCDHEELRSLARTRLHDLDETEVKKWIYWLSCAYLLAPEEFGDLLADYAGRWREKTLPLLDFSAAVLAQEQQSDLRVSARQVAHLLRIIAPTFRRNQPLTGGLDAASGKVMELFDRLANDPGVEARQAVEELQRVRVMRIYADVLEEVAERQRQAVQR